MDISKFLSLIYERALWLTRADCLGDPLEGSLTALEFADQEVTKGELEGISEMRREMLKGVFVSCWHVNEHESAAMWKLYAQSSEAIALKTSVGRLKATLPDWVGFSLIRYVDYDRGRFAFDHLNLLEAFLHKRLSFQHEREFRTLTFNLHGSDGEVEAARDSSGLGVRAPINVEEMIEAVHVSPTAEGWFLRVVERAVESVGLKIPVIRSGLIRDALY